MPDRFRAAPGDRTTWGSELPNQNRYACDLAAHAGTCTVICRRQQRPVADSFLGVLARRFEHLKAHLQHGSISDARCDLVAPVVEADDCREAGQEIIRLKKSRPGARIVPLTVRVSQEGIDGLLRAGARDFISVPFHDDECASRIQRVLDETGPAAPRQQDLQRPPAEGGVVGSSPGFRAILELLPKIAGCDSCVLLLGETGTGKEVIARAIHRGSSRSARPWVAVDCAALPTDLIESELFGHVQGAFTHAHQARSGLAQEAEGGILLLDEIDALPLAAQAKLLRFVQEKEYRPVGSNKVAHADVRIIAASNQNLAELVEQGKFRRDLYFRLNVVVLALPPLRERPEDIPGLAAHFAESFAAQAGRRPLQIAQPALDQLMAHSWPGNVRELRHAIERAAWLTDPKSPCIESFDLGGGSEAGRPRCESFQASKRRVVEAFERDYLLRALSTCGGNISHAAQLAGKNRRAFFALLQKHRIDVSALRAAAGA